MKFLLQKNNFLILLITAFVLRWFLVAGIGDWPGDHNFAIRHLYFEVNNDFFHNYVNPLTFIIISKIYSFVGGDHLLINNLVLWILWLASYSLSIKIIEKLTLKNFYLNINIFSILFIFLYSPINTNFTIYNFFSVFLVILNIYFLIILKSENLKFLLVGIIIAMAISIKPNVAASQLLLSCIYIFIFENKRIKTLLLFFLTIILSVIILSYIQNYKSIIEFLKFTFIAPSGEKGGLFQLFLRSMPRISLDLKVNEGKYLYEILVAIIINLLLLFILILKDKQFNSKIIFNQKFIMINYILILFFSVITLYPLFKINNLINLIKLNIPIFSITEVLHHFNYCLIFISSSFFFIKTLINKTLDNKSFKILIFLFCCSFFVNGALGAAGRYGSIYSIPIFLISIIYGLDKKIVSLKFFNFLHIVALLNFLSWNIMPNHPSTFAKLKLVDFGENKGKLLYPTNAPAFHSKSHHSETLINYLILDLKNKTKQKEILWISHEFQGIMNEKMYRYSLVPFHAPHLEKNINYIKQKINNYPPEMIIFNKNFETWGWDPLKEKYDGRFFIYNNFIKWIEDKYILYDKFDYDLNNSLLVYCLNDCK